MANIFQLNQVNRNRSILAQTSVSIEKIPKLQKSEPRKNLGTQNKNSKSPSFLNSLFPAKEFHFDYLERQQDALFNIVNKRMRLKFLNIFQL